MVGNAFAQKTVNDSLFKELAKLDKLPSNYSNDTQKVNYLSALGYMYQFTNSDSGIIFGKRAFDIASKHSFKQGMARALNSIGICQKELNKYADALESFINAIKYASEANDNKSLADAYLNLGNIYNDQGNFNKAYDYYLKALKIDEKVKNIEGQAGDLTNIGILFAKQADYKKGLSYFFKALEISKEIGKKRLIRLNLSNIGLSYASLKEFDKARDYYKQSFKIAEAMNNKAGMASVLSNLGGTYSDEVEEIDKTKNNEAYVKNLETALDYYLQSIKINKDLGDDYSLALNYGNLANLYIKFPSLKKETSEQLSGYALAEEYLNNALQIGKRITSPEVEKNIEDAFVKLYNETGNCTKEILHLKRAQALNDTLFNQEKKYELMQKEMGFDFDRKEANLIEQQKRKEEIANVEKKKREYITMIIAIGFVVISIFSVFLFRALNLARKQRNIISKQKAEVEEQKDVIIVQKHLVEEKQKEIIDSINYAQRLQQAILPPHGLMEKYFKEYFIMYRPKDIVAGDFYWFERVERDNKTTLYFAVADCTGHGVPGALVSIVCINALTRCVKEFKIFEPNKILGRTRELVIETFEKSESEVKDGMDISLCSLTISIDKDGAKYSLQWSGANNPIWIIKSGELMELVADKQPIGKYADLNPFTNHEVELNSGDQLLLFSDGYADQFGGPKGKKFKYKPMRDLFFEAAKLSSVNQKTIFESTLANWKGKVEQVDDICVMGVKI